MMTITDGLSAKPVYKATRVTCVSEFKRLKKKTSVLSNLGQSVAHKSTIDNAHIADLWVRIGLTVLQ